MLPLFLWLLMGSDPLQTTTPSSGAERMSAYALRLKMERESPLRHIAPRSVGPHAMGARVIALTGFPNDPDTYFCAYASGGLWKSKNRGNSWEPLFDHSASITIGDFAVDPADHNRIWIGTGEENASRSSYAGTGVYHSRDGGRTWTHQGLTDTQHISAVILHPTQKDTLWVAAIGPLYSTNDQRGIFKSIDGGMNWQHVFKPDAGIGVIDLKLDPANPDRMYAATWRRTRKAWRFQTSGAGSGVMTSQDGGSTWRDANQGLPRGSHVGRIGLAVSAAKPNIVYAMVDNQQPLSPNKADEDALSPLSIKEMSRKQLLDTPDAELEHFLRRYDFHHQITANSLKSDLKDGTVAMADLQAYLDGADDILKPDVMGVEIYRSQDFGRSWRRPHAKPIPELAYSYGYYFGVMAVDPSDPDTIYVLGVPLLKSTDGGVTFRNIMRRNVHIDHQAVWINPKNPRHILLGNDGGINMSYDAGEHWLNFNFQPVGQFYTVAYDMASPYRIYGGMQDNGVWRGPSSARDQYDPPWRKVSGGDGAFVQVDPRDNQTIYSGSQFGYYERHNLSTGEVQNIQPRHKLKEPRLRFNWMTPIVLSKHDPDVLYLAAQRIFRSDNRGVDFEAVTADLTTNPKQGNVPFGTITALRESPFQAGLLYAGTDDGMLWRIEGQKQTRLKAPFVKGLWISSIEVSNQKQGELFVTMTGYRNDDFRTYVHTTRNDGKTWKSLKANLPDEPCNVIRQDPVNPDILYLGTDLGLFISFSRGDSWYARSGLPNVPVYAMEIQPREHELILGTHGRSIFVDHLPPIAAITPTQLKEPLNVYAPAGLFLQSDALGRTDPWGLADLSPPSVRFHFLTNAAGTLELTVTHNAQQVYHYSRPVADGLGLLNWDFSVNPSPSPNKKPVAFKRGEDGRHYAIRGEYQLNWSLTQKDGAIHTRTTIFTLR